MWKSALTVATIGGLIASTLLVAVPATAAQDCSPDGTVDIPFVCAWAEGDPTHPGFVIPEGKHWARRGDSGTNGWLYVDNTQVDTCSIQPIFDNWCFTDGNARDSSFCYHVEAKTESFDVTAVATTDIGDC